MSDKSKTTYWLQQNVQAAKYYKEGAWRLPLADAPTIKRKLIITSNGIIRTPDGEYYDPIIVDTVDHTMELVSTVDALPDEVREGRTIIQVSTGNIYHGENGRWVLISEGGRQIDDYNELKGKPKINGVVLENDKSFEDLGASEITPEYIDDKFMEGN